MANGERGGTKPIEANSHQSAFSPQIGEVVLTLSGIGKTYTTPILTEVHLELRAGEVLALAGENGAGKSTLSKIISGLVAPTHGAMTYCNAPSRQ